MSDDALRCGTRLSGVPSAEDMRRARRQQRFMAITDAAVDPDIGACRVALENIAAARKRLRAYRGRPLNVAQHLAALDALERARVPLRDYKDAPAVGVLQRELKMGESAAQSLLRRLVDLRTRLGC